MATLMQAPDSINELGYLHYFGLNQEPFPVAPDDANFYISSHIDTVLTEIIHGIKTRKGFMVLTGDTGLGKTTISRRVIQILDDNNIESSLIIHTSCKNVELLREINRDFGLETHQLRFGDLMKSLNDFLEDKNHKDINCALVVDDAQNLDQKSLELIRMISNFEADRKKLIQILLIGQPELADKLNRYELRQLKSRVIIWQTVRPLRATELESYLTFKLNVSGSSGRLSITKKARKVIYRYTGGNLRHINKLMDRCLYAAFLHDAPEINKRVVMEAIQDLEHNTSKAGRRRFGYIALTGLFILAALFSFYTYFDVKPIPDVINNINSMESLHSLEEEVIPFSEINHITPVSSELLPLKKAAVSPAPYTPEPLKVFLQSYNLSDYERLFHNSLKEGNLAGVSERIYIDTGYRLIHLEKMRPSIQNRYGVLTYRPENETENTYLLFWKPTITTDDIYFGYQSKTIGMFQKKLADMNFYHFEIDGIAGSRFFRAIVEFQKKMGLKPTGFPDEVTLFLLHNECEGNV